MKSTLLLALYALAACAHRKPADPAVPMLVKVVNTSVLEGAECDVDRLGAAPEFTPPPAGDGTLGDRVWAHRRDLDDALGYMRAQSLVIGQLRYCLAKLVLMHGDEQ